MYPWEKEHLTLLMVFTLFGQVMKEIARICRTCWKAKASVRLTMSRVHKNLTQVSVNYDMTEEGEDSGCDHDTWKRTLAPNTVPQPEILTESTRLELETPEQSGKGKVTGISTRPPPRVTEEAPETAPVLQATATSPQHYPAAHVPRSSAKHYGPTDL